MNQIIFTSILKFHRQLHQPLTTNVMTMKFCYCGTNLSLSSSSSFSSYRFPPFVFSEQKRSFTHGSTVRLNNYEGDGKTVATNLSRELAHYVIVQSFNEHGFKMSNGAFAFGSIILFPFFIFQVFYLNFYSII